MYYLKLCSTIRCYYIERKKKKEKDKIVSGGNETILFEIFFLILSSFLKLLFLKFFSIPKNENV
jgi:hypothetical protein